MKQLGKVVLQLCDSARFYSCAQKILAGLEYMSGALRGFVHELRELTRILLGKLESGGRKREKMIFLG